MGEIFLIKYSFYFFREWQIVYMVYIKSMGITGECSGKVREHFYL